MNMDHVTQRQVRLQPCQCGMAQALVWICLHNLAAQISQLGAKALLHESDRGSYCSVAE